MLGYEGPRTGSVNGVLYMSQYLSLPRYVMLPEELSTTYDMYLLLAQSPNPRNLNSKD